MYSSQKKRRVKPYARPTSFDINIQFDIRQYQKVKFGGGAGAFYPAVASDESFNVKEGEVMMSLTNGAKYRTHQLHAFSFANGLDGKSKAEVLEKLKYAGVAVTEFSPSKDVYEQGFVSNLAGLNTLFNNGKDTIHPGDIVCADIPDQDPSNGRRTGRALQGGIPREKIQFIIRPYAKMSSDYGQEIASRFIIGTAVEYARSGNPVSVILHHCNHDVSVTFAGSAAETEEELNESGLLPKKKSLKKSKKGKQ